MSAILGVSLFALALAHSEHAASTGASQNVKVALVSDVTGIRPGQPFHVGLHMRMRKGWHTYWKNPGDAGLPLRIEWRLPQGFHAGSIQWPTPERIPAGSLVSYGYSREVLIPIEIRPPPHVRPDSVSIGGTFDWLECSEACLAGSAELELALPVRPEVSPAVSAAATFAKARSRMPKPPAGWAFAAEAGPRAISLTYRLPPGLSGSRAYLFVDQPLVVEYAEPQGLERVEGGYRLTMTPATNAPGLPSRLTGVLALDDRAGVRARTAVEIDVPVRPGDPAPAPAAASSKRSWKTWAIWIAPLGLALLAVVFLLRRAGISLVLRR